MKSIIEQRGHVSFPEYTGERVYMYGFYKHFGLPIHLKRWESTVNAMLEGVETNKKIYLMIDQGLVKSGNTHRRDGVHIDGYWIEDLNIHGGHRLSPVSENWNNFPNGPGWNANNNFVEPEALILASNVTACRGFKGNFDGVIKEGGDCSNIDTSKMNEVILENNKVYAGNVTMLHESIPVSKTCYRTLVRLSVPGWSPELK